MLEKRESIRVKAAAWRYLESFHWGGGHVGQDFGVDNNHVGGRDDEGEV